MDALGNLAGPLWSLNRELPPNRGLWWPSAEAFDRCDTLAVTRAPGTNIRWSENLHESGVDYDVMFGWGLQTPGENARDVRGRGMHIVSGNFTGWTLEVSRALDTGYADDILIDADGQSSVLDHERATIALRRPGTEEISGRNL